jgi:hypothetical protein
MSKANIFSAPAILTRIAYLKDGGLSLGFATQELSDQDKIIASRFHQKFGHVLFAENEFKEEDIPKGDATDESKSPSQRLRAVLFIAWRQEGGLGDFEYYYRQQMEKFISSVKNRLD